MILSLKLMTGRTGTALATIVEKRAHQQEGEPCQGVVYSCQDVLDSHFYKTCFSTVNLSFRMYSSQMISNLLRFFCTTKSVIITHRKVLRYAEINC